MATVIVDHDAEELLRHFCLETEAEQVRAWCAEHEPRKEEADSRLESAGKLRERGNAALGTGRAEVGVWLYLAALHQLDFSANARRRWLSEPADATRLNKAILPVLSNLAAAFLKRDDHHNADRAATLGFWYRDKCATRDDALPTLHAKLLYRRAQARFHLGNHEEALADITAACQLERRDPAMRSLLSTLRGSVKRERETSSLRGFLGGAKAPEDAQQRRAEDKPTWTPPEAPIQRRPDWRRAFVTAAHAQLVGVDWRPVLFKVGVLVLALAAAVALKLPGSEYISWWQALVPLMFIVLRPVLFPASPKGGSSAGKDAEKKQAANADPAPAATATSPCQRRPKKD